MDVNRIKIGTFHNAELESIERIEIKIKAFYFISRIYYLFKHT